MCFSLFFLFWREKKNNKCCSRNNIFVNLLKDFHVIFLFLCVNYSGWFLRFSRVFQVPSILAFPARALKGFSIWNIKYFFSLYFCFEERKKKKFVNDNFILHLLTFPMSNMYPHYHSKRVLRSAFQMKNGVKHSFYILCIKQYFLFDNCIAK